MTDEPRPTVSRRNLVRALLGRNSQEAPTEPGADPDRHAAGDAAYAAGDYAGAITAYRASVRGDLSNTAVRLKLGHALYATGHYIQAKVEFEHVLRLGTGPNPMARLCLGLTLLAMGKTPKAAAILHDFDDPDRPELVAATHSAAEHLDTQAAIDPGTLRADLERTARALALLPDAESSTASV